MHTSMGDDGRGSAPDVEQLFEKLRNSADANERMGWRRRIITACLPLADNIAYRFIDRGEPKEDLLQVARIGLIKTVDRYDPAKGHFLAFAVPTIRGEVRRYFRDSTWAVRVPRRVQETHLRAREATESLAQRLRRAPSVHEVAEELDVGAAELDHSRRANTAYRPVSLDAVSAVGDGGGGDTLGARCGVDDPGFSLVEDRILLRTAVAQLDPRRREIVGLIYFDGLTQREVAETFGVSQVQVCRLLKDAVRQMRRLVCADDLEPCA